MIRKILVTSLIVFLVLVVACGGVAAGWWFMSRKPVASDETAAVSYKLEVPSGMGIKAVATQLEQQQMIRSQLAFYLLARQQNLQLKAGFYTLRSSMSLEEMFEILQSGRQEHLVVSIPEGLTLTKIGALLEAKGIVASEDFLAAAKDPILLAEYEIPAPSFEGYLFPDTYHFNPSMRAESVVRMMADTFCTRIAGIEGLSQLSSQELFDVVRIDHFRGFEAYYTIPAGAANAKKGKWKKALMKDYELLGNDEDGWYLIINLNTTRCSD